MNNIQIFNHEVFGSVRTLVNEQGEPLFCLKDVCAALELDGKQVVRRLDDGVVSKHPILDSLGRIQQTTFVNEDGLYDVILDSRKPSARAFRKWVTSEVLPQIRKTGGYIPTKDADGRPLTDLEIVCLAFKIQQRTIEEQHKLIDELAPKAEYADEVLESVSCYTTTQIAKELGMTVYDLTRELIGRKVMYKQSGQYMLYAEYARKGYARSRTHLHRDNEGNVYTEMYLVWTEEGREFIHRLIETPPETQSQEELIQLEVAFSA